MKSDLDTLMQEFGYDAIFVTGPAFQNPAMVYLTGGGHMGQADLIKKRGTPGMLFHASMEREEAARTGLPTCGYNQFPLKERMAAGSLRHSPSAPKACRSVRGSSAAWNVTPITGTRKRYWRQVTALPSQRAAGPGIP